jgi:hypothetical protein
MGDTNDDGTRTWVSDLLRWLATSGDTLTVPGVLAINLVFVLVALVKQWIVPGPMYRECVEQRTKLAKSVDETVRNMELKLERQEVEIERLRDRPKGR